ncbi:MAG: ribonuclease HII [Hyphomicrobiales bacterium]|nr:ribonuclease HII [Hyphomicrobiales bacterium]OQW84527.1 MAG: ribonuclease HII [Proteobacteria bacterium ST_bin15]
MMSPARQVRPMILAAASGVAGIDEAGRGPLAGPLAVAAVLLDPRRPIPGLDDSKKLTASRRDELYVRIMAEAEAVSLVFMSTDDIAALNIRGATLAGMRRAAHALSPAATAFVIDGRDVPPGLPAPASAIIGGDGRYAAIAAASIIAKVARDRAMLALANDYPGYGFEQHMGYGTKRHLQALRRLGPTPIHRAGFAPVADALRLRQSSAATC